MVINVLKYMRKLGNLFLRGIIGTPLNNIVRLRPLLSL